MLMVTFRCFLPSFSLTTCDVSHFCPFFPTLEKCHLGRHRPSNWHLWQSARLKGHAPVGMGSPGCAMSGCCLHFPSLHVISILKSGNISTSSNNHIFSIYLALSLEPECCFNLSEGFICRSFLFFFFPFVRVLLRAIANTFTFLVWKALNATIAKQAKFVLYIYLFINGLMLVVSVV